MDIFKPIRLRRIEKTRERKERQMQKEQEKSEERQNEKEFQQFFEIAKKGEFLLNYCSKLYINKIGKNLDDYYFKNVKSVDSGYKNIEEVILDTEALMIKKAKKLEAEVVTDVRPSIAYHCSLRVVCITGTALIPKKKK